ncbi:oligosaccharide flippase family protein [Sporolactobacillus nakayamae]|uniref:Membrane protein involved in the export of O-antigen and teichoic acid n=1 Tax=Sporolactobacillus nakayamae TaxID=269670 RepID=A0A1I2W6G6_9BACL|nr:oligosaccharide flippase family protein [Sporolactobacillus nakayamae]SFG96239.1 Membrane protein involved in the export of O-antigen and teichoic acid [Sporolactobacillus nakayamae]
MNLIRIIKNALYLLFGNIGVRVITVLSIIFLTRLIGPDEYGIFSIAIAITSIAVYCADLGLTATFIRDANKKNSDISQLLSTYIIIRILLSFGVAILAYILLHVFYKDQPYLMFIINGILYPSLLGTVFQGAATAYFQSKERMFLSSLIVVIQGILSSSVIFIAVFFRWKLTVLAPVYGCTNLITGLIALVLLLNCASIKKGWNTSLFKQLVAFSINGLIIMMLPQLGPIILEKVASLNSVGFFSVAYKIPSVLYQVPGVVATAFFPRLFALGNNQLLKEHRNLSIIELKLMSFTGMCISLPFIINPEFWISLLFGEKWLPASGALMSLSYMIVLQSINFPLADYLTTRNQQYKRMLIMAVGLLTAVISYTILGKYFGLLGGAFSPIIIETSLLLGFCIIIKNSLLFLWDGIRYNVLAFIICRLLAFLIPIGNFLFGHILITIFFIFLVLVMDRNLFIKVKEIFIKRVLHSN